MSIYEDIGFQLVDFYLDCADEPCVLCGAKHAGCADEHEEHCPLPIAIEERIEERAAYDRRERERLENAKGAKKAKRSRRGADRPGGAR